MFVAALSHSAAPSMYCSAAALIFAVSDGSLSKLGTGVDWMFEVRV